MALKFISFESGSKGNCSLVMSDNTAILIDAGLSPRALNCELGKLGLTMCDLSGVLITHEHSDHIAWVDKYSEVMDVYSTDKTIKSITDKSKKILNVGEVFNFMFGFDIGDLHINPFSISHDAVDPVGYSITQDDKKISIATDSGWPSSCPPDASAAPSRAPCSTPSGTSRTTSTPTSSSSSPPDSPH